MHDRARQVHLSRFRRIAEVLARHGLSHLAAILGLERFGSILGRSHGHHGLPASATAAEHLRLALCDLGVTFIKLGQVLSTRPDLLPPAYVAELAKLQDARPRNAPTRCSPSSSPSWARR
jgi:ubiquinone biosynthesis protein